MSGFFAKGQVEEMELAATVIRADGSIEELGAIAYWHRNPFRRLAARLRGLGRIKTTPRSE